MSAKKYVISLASILYIFLVINLSLWHIYTKEFFTQSDLNRLGSFYTVSSLTGPANYQRHHEKFTPMTTGQFDVITIGDSFSQGGYQDYFADKLGMKVLNVNMTGHCLNDIYRLISSGIIDEFRPKAVILESVERSVQGRLGVIEIVPVKISREDLLKRISRPKTSENISRGIFAPVMIGLTVSMLICLIAPLTQAGFNPARDFSPRMVAYMMGWKNAAFPLEYSGFFWVYICSPIVGGLLASLLFTKFIEPVSKAKDEKCCCCSENEAEKAENK